MSGRTSEADAVRAIKRRAGTLTDADVDAGLRERGAPTTADFRAVGLSETDAASAARGLESGLYVSFEDACLAKAAFSYDGRTRLNHRMMRETAGRFQITEGAGDGERAAAERHARNRITEANGELPQPVVDRIVATATRTVPLTESGQLDTAALDTAVDAARTAEEAYVARLAEASGAGRVRGFGFVRQTVAAGREVSEADVDAMIARRAGGTQVEDRS